MKKYKIMALEARLTEADAVILALASKEDYEVRGESGLCVLCYEGEFFHNLECAFSKAMIYKDQYLTEVNDG